MDGGERLPGAGVECVEEFVSDPLLDPWSFQVIEVFREFSEYRETGDSG